MNFNKVIIWGFPLHTHTHSYIHGGWYKAFQHLGYETHWFHDGSHPTVDSDFDYGNYLFINQLTNKTKIKDLNTSRVVIIVEPYDETIFASSNLNIDSAFTNSLQVGV